MGRGSECPVRRMRAVLRGKEAWSLVRRELRDERADERGVGVESEDESGISGEGGGRLVSPFPIYQPHPLQYQCDFTHIPEHSPVP
jgi:hypothetical protein